MKKSITLTFLLLITSVIIHAQTFRVGPEVGVEYAQFQETFYGNNHWVKPALGVALDIEFGEKFAIGTGLYYSQKAKGFDSTYFEASSAIINTLIQGVVNIEGLNTDFKNEVRGIYQLNYIELPVLAKYKLSNFTIGAGPYVGYLVSSKETTELNSSFPLLEIIDITTLGIDPALLALAGIPDPNEPPVVTTTDDPLNINKFNYGAQFGVGYSMKSVSFNFNYCLGLADYRVDLNGEDKSPFQTFRMSIAYKFKVPADGVK